MNIKFNSYAIEKNMYSDIDVNNSPTRWDRVYAGSLMCIIVITMIMMIINTYFIVIIGQDLLTVKNFVSSFCFSAGFNLNCTL